MRTDIYSLGVLLYELLTGTTPFGQDRLREVSEDELRPILLEEEPPRPSARITTLEAATATTVVEHRRTDPRRLLQSVRGDLDWIVTKCLEKDRSSRFIGYVIDERAFRSLGSPHGGEFGDGW